MSFVPCIIYLAIIAIPLLLMQAFMGQFSSTGFISAFRMSPLFKGIFDHRCQYAVSKTYILGVGYLGLVLNIISAAYSIIFAAVPLFYLINSLQYPLPWSCYEGEDKFPSEVRTIYIELVKDFIKRFCSCAANSEISLVANLPLTF